MATLPDQFSAKPVGRHRLPREVMVEHQRERILDVAADVFAKRGYSGTTVDDIVAAGKIGVGSFYGFFDNKEDCFLQCYDGIVSRSREQVLGQLAEDEPFPERVANVLAGLLLLVEANPLNARIVLIEAQAAGSSARERLDALNHDVVTELRAGRELAAPTLKLPDTLEEAIIGGVSWLVQQRLHGGQPEQIGSLLPELTAIVLEPYIGEAAAKRTIEKTRRTVATRD
jgi:AcrR family transcriptional regulator